ERMMHVPRPIQALLETGCPRDIEEPETRPDPGVVEIEIQTAAVAVAATAKYPVVRVGERVEDRLAERALPGREELAAGSKTKTPVHGGQRVERAPLRRADIDRAAHARALVTDEVPRDLPARAHPDEVHALVARAAQARDQIRERLGAGPHP